MLAYPINKVRCQLCWITASNKTECRATDIENTVGRVIMDFAEGVIMTSCMSKELGRYLSEQQVVCNRGQGCAYLSWKIRHHTNLNAPASEVLDSHIIQRDADLGHAIIAQTEGETFLTRLYRSNLSILN